MLAEHLGDAHLQFVAHAGALTDFGDENAQFEILRAVAETGHPAQRCGIAQHQRMRRGDLEQQLLRLTRIVAIGDADLDDDARDRIASASS